MKCEVCGLLDALKECITDEGAACHNAKGPHSYIAKLNRRLRSINEIASRSIAEYERKRRTT